MGEILRPFYIDFDETQFRDFARTVPLTEDEALMLQSYSEYAAENDTTGFSLARITDFLVAKGAELNLPKIKSLPNVRRMISQTGYSLRDKNFIRLEIEGSEILRIQLIDPAKTFLEDYYSQMLANTTLPFPEEDAIRRYLIQGISVDVQIADVAQGMNPRLREEPKLIALVIADPPTRIFVSASTIDVMLEVCYLKLKNVLTASTSGRLGEDMVKEMTRVMPQKTSTVERMVQILSHNEAESPLYLVNLANRLAAYFSIDREKRGILTLMHAARIVEGFKGYEWWLESEKNNVEKIREYAIKLLGSMAEVPALISYEDIVQKIQSGASGLEGMTAVLNTDEIQKVVRLLITEFTMFQGTERELLPPLLKFTILDMDYFIHREALLIFFESERKRVRAELLSRFRKLWYAQLLKNELRSSMQYDEFFAQDVEKFVKENESTFIALMHNPQAMINAFFISSRHNVSQNLSEVYFLSTNNQLFKPLHRLLELDRKTILSQVKSELPFVYRFPFLKWLAELFGLLKKPIINPVVNEEKKESYKTIGKDTTWHRTLNMVETKLLGEKNTESALKDLLDRWNIKLGDARRQFSEKVNAEIEMRAKRLYAMTRKLPEITQSFLAEETGNLANLVMRRFRAEAGDEKSLQQYAQIKIIDTLKHLNG